MTVKTAETGQAIHVALMAAEGDDDAAAGETPWSGVLAVEGVWTGDGRFIEDGGVTWADLPLPLMADRAFLDGGGDGHFGSFIAGRIDVIERVGSEIRGSGVLDSSEQAAEVVRRVAAGMANGISIDPDSVEVAVYDEVEEGLRFSALRIRGATVVPMAAFVEATITVDVPATTEEEPAEATATIHPNGDTRTPVRSANVVVASIPARPPAVWFDDPLFDDLQQHTTITADGQISGHLAGLNECHIGYTNKCLTAATLVSDWRYFTTGYVPCEDGCRIPTGPITLVGGHADLSLNLWEAKAHYDDTDSAIADIALGVDMFGIWFAGALRPGVTDAQIRVLAASGVSGDWRPMGGRDELCAVAACNTPGFPKVLGVRVASGELVALVASAWRSGEVPAVSPLAVQVDALAARVRSLERQAVGGQAVLRALDPIVRPTLRQRMGVPARHPSAFRNGRRPR
jgi:hypothetical protein